MNAAEKRQAQRIVRNTRELERHLFDVVQELQYARDADEGEHDWQSTIGHLRAVQDRLPIVLSLALNIDRETSPNGRTV